MLHHLHDPRSLLSKLARAVIELAWPLLLDGDALGLRCLPGALLRILAEHAGENGESAGAEEVLRRLALAADRPKAPAPDASGWVPIFRGDRVRFRGVVMAPDPPWSAPGLGLAVCDAEAIAKAAAAFKGDVSAIGRLVESYIEPDGKPGVPKGAWVVEVELGVSLGQSLVPGWGVS